MKPKSLPPWFLVLLAILPGCLDTHTWKEKERPWVQSSVAESDQVRIEDSSGLHYTLDHPRIGRDERGEFLAGRQPDRGGKEVRMDLADVRFLEVREVDVGVTATAVVAGIVVLAGLGVYLIFG